MELEGQRDINFQLNYDLSLESLARFHSNIDAAPSIKLDHLFVLLLGPSSVGKSTLIRSLNEITGNRFVYLNPFTTRKPRPEDDKRAITTEEFDALEQAGTFIQVNTLYGAKYGPPLANVHEALSTNKIPILDFPLDKVHELERPEYNLLNIYVFPPTVGSWINKLNSLGRNNSNERLDAGLREIHSLTRAYLPHPDIHLSIINQENNEYSGASEIASFIEKVK